MATESRETEKKYDFEPGARLPSLRGLPQVSQEDDLDEQTLEADYYDTAGLHLIRAGVTLRRRRGGHDQGWHLKLPLDGDSRREIRLPLGRASRRVPAELAVLVRAHARGEALQPVAQVTTRRRRRALLDDEGGSLAEVMTDDVSARTMGESMTLTQWRELEVELTGGGPHLLRAADQLREELKWLGGVLGQARRRCSGPVNGRGRARRRWQPGWPQPYPDWPGGLTELSSRHSPPCSRAYRRCLRYESA